MKRIAALILMVCLLCACDAASSGDANSSSYVPDTLESYDNESVFVPPSDESETAVSEQTSAESKPTAGFVIKDKKYTYEGNDLVILEVENQTDKHYVLTITGTYLDKDGKALKTETQTFDGFAAGGHNYFLFQPQITFNKFVYEVETAPFEGTCLMADYAITEAKLTEKMSSANFANGGDTKKYPTIFATIQETNTFEKEINVFRHMIVIDQFDRIYLTKFRSNTVPAGNPEFGWSDHQLYYEITDGKMTWPEELQGDVKILVAVTKIEIFEGAY